MLAPSDIKLVAWPASSPVAGGYTKVEDVVNRGLIAPVVENEPFTATKVAPIEAGAGLAPTIATGMRAISVKVNEVIGVAGFVVPGTRVDVVVTMGKQDDSISRVIVSNAQVLTAERSTTRSRRRTQAGSLHGGHASRHSAGCGAHRAGVDEGSIMLALRNPLDATTTETKGTRLAP
jgi:pilus assembly protein CpaB